MVAHPRFSRVDVYWNRTFRRLNVGHLFLSVEYDTAFREMSVSCCPLTQRRKPEERNLKFEDT